MKRILIAVTAVIALVLPSLVRADTANCDSNAVIWCGAASQAELTQKTSNGDGHNSAANIQAIFAQFGVNPANFSQTVMGTVKKDGTVWVGSQMVASGAQSVGRQFIPGSTQQGSVFIRPTSVSFRSDSLTAFVFMPNGQFAWAVLVSCGNPVVATAVVKPLPTPPPPPPKPQPIIKTIQPVPAPPPPAPVTIITPPPPAPITPASGASDELPALGISALVASALGYYVHSRGWLSAAWLGLTKLH